MTPANVATILFGSLVAACLLSIAYDEMKAWRDRRLRNLLREEYERRLRITRSVAQASAFSYLRDVEEMEAKVDDAFDHQVYDEDAL